MLIPIKQTKIVLPGRRRELLSRERLLTQLQGMVQKRLVFVSAPAGYGKTSLLVDFAHSTSSPVAWFALDALDRDPRRFAAHFIAAIASQVPDFGRRTLAYLTGLPPGGTLDPEILSTHIVNELIELQKGDLLLILDDFHHIDEISEVVDFVNQFVLDMPEKLHLVAASRSLPSLPDLPLMVGRMQIAGLSFDELRFRPGEIQDLLIQSYQIELSDQDAHALANAAEGWITGLMLTAQNRWHQAMDQLRIARLSGIGLYQYLAQQILDQQPDEIRKFLLLSSVFDEFNPALCREVLGDRFDWDKLIQEVWRKNLFILVVEKEGSWYRYHPLFRDFLIDRLQAEAVEEYREILERLANRHIEEGDWDKSHEVSRRLGDPVRLAGLIELATDTLTRAGRYRTIQHWLDDLPVEVLESRPRLIALDGILKVVLNDVEAGVQRLSLAIERFRASGERLALAETLIKRTFGYRNLENYRASLVDAEQAFSIAEKSDIRPGEQEESWRRIRADALRAIGINQVYLGRVGEAVQTIRRSLQQYRSLGDPKNEALTRNDLGFVLNHAGNYHAAISEYEQALGHWNAHQNLIQQATVLNNLAVAQHALGNYSEAAENFSAAIEYAKKAGYRRIESLAEAGLGDLYTDLGLYEAAQQIYARSRQVAEKQRFIFMLFYLDLMESRLLRRIPDWDTAQRLLRRSGERAQASNNAYELGLHAFHTGQFAYEKGEYDQAIDWLGRALDHFSTNGYRVETGKARFLLAGSYMFTKQRQAAVHALKSGLSDIGDLENQGIIYSVGYLIRDWLEDLVTDPEVGPQAHSIMAITEQVSANLSEMRLAILPSTAEQDGHDAHLFIRAFGQPKVSIDGRDITSRDWQTQVARDMLFCLLAHPTGLGRDELGEIFWPAKPVENLRKNVKNTLYRLRKAIGKNSVRFDDDRYRFGDEIQYYFDVEAFSRALQLARKKTFPDERLPYYRQAVELYRGDYLPDVDYPWANQERESLRRRYLQGEMEYGELLIEQKEFVAALESSFRVLMVEPCEESAHRRAMRANYAMGNTAGIVRQYQRCEEDLQQILNARPSVETTDLYLQLTR